MRHPQLPWFHLSLCTVSMKWIFVVLMKLESTEFLVLRRMLGNWRYRIQLAIIYPDFGLLGCGTMQSSWQVPHFGGTCCLHLQGLKCVGWGTGWASQAGCRDGGHWETREGSNEMEPVLGHWEQRVRKEPWVSVTNPEDGDTIFLWNVSAYLQDYRRLQPRKQYSEKLLLWKPQNL
jgi:hypothetical protein